MEFSVDYTALIPILHINPNRKHMLAVNLVAVEVAIIAVTISQTALLGVTAKSSVPGKG